MKYTLQYAAMRDGRRAAWIDVDTFDTFEAAHAASGKLAITSDNSARFYEASVWMLGARDRIVKES